ncbi:MAG: prephenate dehydrogenase/arogenate dehydrogenase family protein [Deltaproteobacteria bacterium]|nr:prephenate dehydrogenase/arogenate dehydrogenase family protein [Deltaproteobacteria bacterium]
MTERQEVVSIALYGALGEMGSKLLTPLFPSFGKVTSIDRNSSNAASAEALHSDIIVLSVPRERVEAIIGAHQFRAGQLIIDICSLKNGISKAVKSRGGDLLSLHPMNGPLIEWEAQKWLVVGDVPKHPFASQLLAHLKSLGVTVLEVSSEDAHDKLMEVVLGIPELTSIAIDRMMEEMADQPNLLEILKAGSPAFAALMASYIHTIGSTAPWLRADLISGSGGTLPERFRLSMKKAADEITDPPSLHSKLSAQLESLTKQGLGEEFRAGVRDIVIGTFSFLNQKVESLLSDEKTEQRPLVIQYEAQDKFTARDGKPVFGIHGIEGSFTDEALYRFFSENPKSDPSAYEIKELVHSHNVLRAVNAGEVDYGIFAFANSGSGGYLASIEAMGQFNYRLLALFVMPISMCILAHSSVESMSEISTFYGHPVAIAQCRKTLARRWPGMKIEPMTDEMDTALSAKLLSSGEIPKDKAVFASARAAKLYGLKTLASAVHHDPNNATAFAIVGPAQPAH